MSDVIEIADDSPHDWRVVRALRGTGRGGASGRTPPGKDAAVATGRAPEIIVLDSDGDVSDNDGDQEERNAAVAAMAAAAPPTPALTVASPMDVDDEDGDVDPVPPQFSLGAGTRPSRRRRHLRRYRPEDPPGGGDGRHPPHVPVAGQDVVQVWDSTATALPNTPKRLRILHPGLPAAEAERPRLKDPPGGAPAAPKAVRYEGNSGDDGCEVVPFAGAGAPVAATVVLTVDDDDNVDDDSVQALVVAAPRRPELRVLEVLPDVDLNHVTQLLDQFDGDSTLVVAHLLEQPNYPKSKTSDASGGPMVTQSAGAFAGTFSVPIHRESAQQRRQWTRDYSSASSFAPSEPYKDQARKHLRRRFPWLSAEGSKLLLFQSSSRYAVAVERMVRFLQRGDVTDGGGHATVAADPSEEAERLNRYEAALRSRTLDPGRAAQLQRWLGPASSRPVFVKTAQRIRAVGDGGRGDGVTDEILREEIEYTDDRLQAWIRKASLFRARERNKARVQQLGTGTECACCCDDFDIDDMVACRREGHLFCVDCLQRHASTKLFGEGNLGIDRHTKRPALELLCFHSDGCDSPFDRPTLAKALDAATLLKYDEVQAQLTVSLAGLSDLVTCPKCRFQATLAPSVRVFVCPCDDCGFTSCRECGEAAHIPFRCDEVEKEAETKGRLTVEEAISAAKIRQCPNCKKAFVKSDGCNKVRCGCGIFVCYICRQRIGGYDHFCQTAHCKHERCGKCRLHSNSDYDDELAMKEAGIKAAEEVKTQLAARTTKELSIDVDSILKNPDRPQLPAPAGRGAPARPQPAAPVLAVPAQPRQPQMNYHPNGAGFPDAVNWRRLDRAVHENARVIHEQIQVIHEQARVMEQEVRAMQARYAAQPNTRPAGHG